MLIRLDELLKKNRMLGSGLLILVALVTYQGVLSCGFVSDDVEQILQNPFVKNPHMWKRIFEGRVWSFAGGLAQTRFYRPLHIFTYWLICRVAGLNPFAYHVVQLALYTLTICIVYQLGRRLLQNELAALAGALLWALHPLHVEAVAWAAAIPEIGCGLFCVLGFWMFLRAEEQRPPNLWWHVAAAAVYFPALFFKEVAFSFPLLLLVYWFCHPSTESWLRRAANWLPYVAAAGVCAAIRVAVMGNVSKTSLFKDLNPQVAGAALGLLGRHFKLFLWPATLSEFRDFDITASLHSPWPWLALVVIVTACVWRKREPHLSFLVLWWFVTLIPCLDYRYISIPLIADRFSYLPSVGLCLALGYLAFGLLPRHFPKADKEWIVVGAFAVVAVLWAAQAVRTIPQWRDDDAQSRYALRVSPNAAEVHAVRGVALQFQQGDYAGAAREFQTALRLNADSLRPVPSVSYNAYIGLGQVSLDQGQMAEGIDYFDKAVQVIPNSSVAYGMLGSVYFPRSDYARSAVYFEQAVRLNPLDIGARFFLGSCWMRLGKPAQAAEQFHAARDVDPTYSQAYVAEAAALEAAGDKAGAARVRSEIPPE